KAAQRDYFELEKLLVAGYQITNVVSGKYTLARGESTLEYAPISELLKDMFLFPDTFSNLTPRKVFVNGEEVYAYSTSFMEGGTFLNNFIPEGINDINELLDIYTQIDVAFKFLSENGIYPVDSQNDLYLVRTKNGIKPQIF